MNRRISISLLWGLVASCLSIVLSMALVLEASPFYQDTLRPGWTRWVWEIANIPAFLGTMVTRTLATGIFIMVLQWFLVGFIVAWLATGKRDFK